MAVYTELSDEDLATVLARFGLGAPRAFKGIAEGVSNSNFFLETDAGRFILTIFERRFERVELPFFMALMAHLADRGVPAPRPLRTIDGGHVADVRGKPAAIVTFLEGVSPKRPTIGQCRAIGAALARMHLAAADFPHARKGALMMPAWAPMVRPRLDLAERLRSGLAAEIAADLDALEGGWPRDLPTGVIHEDLFPDNTLFLGDEVAGVFDFYFACNDFLAYDLAVCLNAWCFDERAFHLTRGMALIGGYESVRPLSAAERTALPLLARGAAMRFFATRLVDWDDRPEGAILNPKDPLDYADRLDFHRRASSAAAYGA